MGKQLTLYPNKYARDLPFDTHAKRNLVCYSVHYKDSFIIESNIVKNVGNDIKKENIKISFVLFLTEIKQYISYFEIY